MSAIIANRKTDSSAALGGQSVITYDRQFEREILKLFPGDYGATGLDLVFSTVLGSCVSACLYDPIARIGGMNHFLLPGTVSNDQVGRYGMYAMELLINEMLKRGAQRNRLAAKVFGGARVQKSMITMDVGGLNADFIEKYLADEDIPIVAADLRSTRPRKVIFFPATGQALVRNVGATLDSSEWQKELAYASTVSRAGPIKGGDIELF
ncbi:MAG: chemoreceptor glutamine deamidase CheD [Oceanococcaceae bacterium]